MYAGPVAAIGRPMEVLDESKLQVSAIRLPLAGHNDSDAEIDAECAWIAEQRGRDVPLHFTAFHPDYSCVTWHARRWRRCVGPAESRRPAPPGDVDAEVAGKPGQAVVITLSDRAEPPVPVSTVDLEADECGFHGRGGLEHVLGGRAGLWWR